MDKIRSAVENEVGEGGAGLTKKSEKSVPNLKSLSLSIGSPDSKTHPLLTAQVKNKGHSMS